MGIYGYGKREMRGQTLRKKRKQERPKREPPVMLAKTRPVRKIGDNFLTGDPLVDAAVLTELKRRARKRR